MQKNSDSERVLLSPACLLTLQLSQVHGLGVKSFHRLKDHFGTVQTIMEASYDDLLGSGLKPSLAEAVLNLHDAEPAMDGAYHERLLTWLEDAQNRVLCVEDAQYPSELNEIYCPPPVLYVQGNIAVLEQDTIAVVGSRRPTHAGQKHAHRFAKELAEAGFCIASGLAIGIDTQAHKGALLGGGPTCAVLGAGLGAVYPKQNQALAEQITDQGVLISELALDVAALPANFPRRNRIIAGMSRGVLVIEAGLRSGSLITAEFAIEQNRDVFAVPGSIDNPLAKGAHALIKEGATLVESTEDVLVSLGRPARNDGSVEAHSKLKKPAYKSEPIDHQSTGKGKQKSTPKSEQGNILKLSLEEQKVISFMADQPTSFDDLVYCLDMDVSVLTNILVTLEIKGLLFSGAGGYQLR